MKPEYDDSICAECAEKLGGTWPKGHQTTGWYGACDICGWHLPLCSAGDWDWPDGKSHGMRD